MRRMRLAGFLKARVQAMYGKAFFGRPYYEECKMRMLWQRAFRNERKVYGVPRKSCA